MSQPDPYATTVVVRRYGYSPDLAEHAGHGVLRERATWVRLADGDPHGVAVPGYGGVWMLLSVAEPLADLASLGSPPAVDAFGDVVDDGGRLDKPLDLYALPLAPGVEEITEERAVELVGKHAAWAAGSAPAPAGTAVPAGGGGG